jgi:NAD(P)H-hydrate epimerase
VDVPSGLNADTGEPGGVAIKADYTVTFLAAKVGFARPAARAYTGRVTVVDIGAPLPADPSLCARGKQMIADV